LMLMCPDRYAVVSAAALVLNQRLVRRLCPACQGAGCATCLKTGYHDRAPLVEWLRVDDPLRAALRERGPEAVKPTASLKEAAAELLKQRLTNAAELQRVLAWEESLK